MQVSARPRPGARLAAQQADPASLLSHYKTLIRLRTGHQALQTGYYLPATASAATVLGYARILGNGGVLVAANVGSAPVSPALSVSVSTLAPGLYYASDLYTGQQAGTLTVDSLGGFSNWQPTLPPLEANQTWMLNLTTTQAPAAVSRAGAAFSLTLLPNPASTQVRIRMGNAPSAACLVHVYDLTGRLQQATSFTGQSTIISTVGWPNGSYFVRVASGALVAVQRLVVAK